MCLFKKFKINRLTKKLISYQKDRLYNQPTEENRRKEIAGYHELCKLYQKLVGYKKFPYAQSMVLACYRAASALDDVSAQFTLGKYLLEEAKFKSSLQQQALFSSPVNARQVQQIYAEAHAYLLAAEHLNHAQAKRLRGLCYINGWGVDVDKEIGFEMIVESIEQEKSWDKVPQIFAALGLNKPEFFTALMQRRQK